MIPYLSAPRPFPRHRRIFPLRLPPSGLPKSGKRFLPPPRDFPPPGNTSALPEISLALFPLALFPIGKPPPPDFSRREAARPFPGLFQPSPLRFSFSAHPERARARLCFPLNIIRARHQPPRARPFPRILGPPRHQRQAPLGLIPPPLSHKGSGKLPPRFRASRWPSPARPGIRPPPLKARSRCFWGLIRSPREIAFKGGLRFSPMCLALSRPPPSCAGLRGQKRFSPIPTLVRSRIGGNGLFATPRFSRAEIVFSGRFDSTSPPPTLGGQSDSRPPLIETCPRRGGA